MASLYAEQQYGNPAFWAMVELNGTELGDARRTERLIKLTSALVANPTSSLPEACKDWSETKGAYRFLGNEEIKPEMILSGHRRSTLKRISEQDVVLLVQDTTALNFTSHRATKGLGPIGGKRAPEYSAPMGFFAHSCIAVTTQGLMLGLLAQKCWARTQGEDSGDDERMDEDDKESARWTETLESSTQELPAGVTAITVGDREADIYKLFATALSLGQHALVRAQHNRRLPQGKRLWAEMEQAPVVGTMVIEVPRADDRPPRTTTLELRVTQVRLQTPKEAERICVTAVLAREIQPPEGEEPIEWRLLTTLPVTSAEDARNCVRWYTKRWTIERFHYTLKSGCQVEELQLETVDRLQRAVSVYSVVAWRLMYLTLLARVEPEASSTRVLSDAEWKALYCQIHETKQVPADPPDLQTAVLWIARLGGFLGRKRDGKPGLKVLWRGYRRLEDSTVMWKIMQ